MNYEVKLYSLGFGEVILRDRGNYKSYVNEENIEILCNINEESMVLKVGLAGDSRSQNVIANTYNIVDLNTNGDRWEGYSIDHSLSGFGKIYDESNTLTYRGYLFNGVKTCFGEDYYEDGKTVEFKGTFMNGMRHGWGILYDKCGKSIYEGLWHFGNNTPDHIIPSNCNDHKLFTDCVRELTLGDNCYSDITYFKLNNVFVLEKLTIGNCCFCNVLTCEISDCRELKTVVIGKRCFTKIAQNEKVVICNCHQLKSIEIGDSSFRHYSSFEMTSLFRMLCLLDLPYLKMLVIGNKGGCFLCLKTVELSSNIKLIV